ncbi:MAG: hypothetical protein Q8N53_24980 [Longimicrobiales bacterium]|nr:hypothetical protein [Longimicrobiales bacterium]
MLLIARALRWISLRILIYIVMPAAFSVVFVVTLNALNPVYRSVTPLMGMVGYLIGIPVSMFAAAIAGPIYRRVARR